jgi:putative (di)nucleoside polyphosphate hydrolase
VIDANGFRLNVGIILVNDKNQLFWGKKIGKKNAWQFPQGGINKYETPTQALFRELKEEVGLSENDVSLIACSQGWLKYRLPKRYIRYYCKPLCIGQKQKWFLLRLNSSEQKLCLDHSNKPEFDGFRWVYYWHPVKEVVHFKRRVYQMALKEFEPLVRS